MQQNIKKIILILLFVILFFGVRFYFYTNPLEGEEGIFAEIAVNHPEVPNFLLSGRVDGQKIFHWPAHPIALYYMVRGAGDVFSPIFNMVSWQDDTQITPVLRLFFSLSQLTLFVLILLFLLFQRKRWCLLSMLVLTASMISPTAVMTSLNLQVDGSVGILMSGLFAMTLLCLSSSTFKQSTLRVLLFVTSFFLALGKQEWSIIAIAALGCTAVYIYLLRSADSTNIKTDAAILGIVLAGLVLGNLFSYLLSPQSYSGGFQIIWRFSDADGMLQGHFDIQKWYRLTVSRLRWTSIPIALMGICGLLVLSRFRRLKATEALLLCYGMGLFIAYFLSNFNPSARYFAPSLIVLTISTISLLRYEKNRWSFILIALGLFLMLTANGIFLYNNIVKKPKKDFFNTSEVKSELDQLAILTTADAWNKPEIDFVNRNMGKENCIAFAQRHGKTLYPEDYVWWNDRQADKSQ